MVDEYMKRCSTYFTGLEELPPWKSVCADVRAPRHRKIEVQAHAGRAPLLPGAITC